MVLNIICKRREEDEAVLEEFDRCEQHKDRIMWDSHSDFHTIIVRWKVNSTM